MASQEIPSEILALNAYDDTTFISEGNSRREQAADFTCRPTLPSGTLKTLTEASWRG